ncbi:seipin-1-like [Phragmites australis]|uniref:seipin-1-like n=1 Tax=Phragmites australis TaxID=29695 RepID=UPI002D76C341|nr:seipin-1-like [Phragmites australis]
MQAYDSDLIRCRFSVTPGVQIPARLLLAGNGLYTGRPRSTAAGESNDDALLFLAVSAGWLVWLFTFLGEHVASAILSLFFPFAALVGALRALAAVVASNLRRAAFGLLATACAFAVLVSELFVSVLLGFVLVRHWVEEPVTVRQPLYFVYTEAQPSAAVVLGSARGAAMALPAGHSVRVSMALLLPDSYHNREVDMFQVYVNAYYLISDPKFLELSNSFADLHLMINLFSVY